MCIRDRFTTGGGTIDANGLFNATTIGEFTITVQDGNVFNSVDINIVEMTDEPEMPSLTDCEADSPNGDYSYIASLDSENPTLEFIPSVVGHGDTTCLLYYKTSANNNFTDVGVTPNVPQQIIASEGDTVSFYYTYSLASGGENNTSSSPQSFLVGGCIVSSINSISNSAFSNLVLSPNPSNREDVYLSGIKEDVIIDVFSINGQLLSSNSIVNTESFKINTSDFLSGVYVVSVRTMNGNYTKTYKFVVN